METETITLQIPRAKTLPSPIENFTPEETYKILEFGILFLTEGKNQVSSLLLEDALQEKHRELENLRQSLMADYEEKCTKHENLYKSALETSEKKISSLKQELDQQRDLLQQKFSQEYQKKTDILETKIQKDREFFERERERNEKTLEKLQDMIRVTSTKTSVKLGIAGENIFQELAHTAFRDFDNFCIKYTGDQTSKGDYHLFFKDFSVLVDTKNYTGNVNNASKKKFRVDMENNSHMKIAWLISMNSSIDSYDRYPIMFEMMGEQCVFFVNNLMKYEEPVEMLRLLWSISNNINGILSTRETGEEEFKEYKTKIEGIVRELEKIQKEENLLLIEMSKSLEKMRQNKKTTKDFLTEILNDKINTEVQNEYENVLNEQLIDSVRNWCDAKLRMVPETKTVIKYTEIWDRFEKDIENRRFHIKKMKFREFLLEIYKDQATTKKAGEFIGLEWL